MAPKFGTSGLRGLVTDLTPDLITDVVRAYLACCAHGGAVMVGRDLRASSPQIAAITLDAIRSAGLDAINAGAVPTPALALAAGKRGCGAIMVTGSHIPADRNGLKFYTVTGEISKDDEHAILAARGRRWPVAGCQQDTHDAPETASAYVARYLDAFGPHALRGLRVGVYQHSSVARDLMMDVLAGLGAVPVALARADDFVAVDTEAVAPETRAQLAQWCTTHRLDALISTDGDADRPLLCDAQGQVVAGDILGVLTARALQADVICTPVSSNSMIDDMPEFRAVHRTRIGSPHVIAAMQDARATDPAARVVGYEANGGFLLGFAANGPAGHLAPLMTRDCLLPVIASLALAQSAGTGIDHMIAGLPPRFTAADRLQNIPASESTALIAGLHDDPQARAAFFSDCPAEQAVDMTDGLRVTFANGDIVHLRPSGNAPECRCYAEAATPSRAQALVTRYLGKLAETLAR